MIKNLLLIFGIGVLFTSCQDEVVERYKVSSPKYMSYTDLRMSVKAMPIPGDELKKPGKIYYWNNYLLVNEINKGIHVIDNHDPSKPVFKTFINIPGNVDMSVKDGILFADSYIDLVAIDISDINNIKEIKRLDSIFPYTIPEYENRFVLEQVNMQKGVVVGYTEKYVEKELYQPENNYYPIMYERGWGDLAMNSVVKTASSSSSSGSTNSGIGIGGSMARFTITGDVLYAINNSSQILVFDITDVQNPIKKGEVSVGWGIETLFPYENKLFIGSQTGMMIYSLSSPFQPQFITSYQHIRSCDPVVVEGDYAYVTLRTGTRCFGSVNRLDIVNISEITNPKTVKEYDMTNPHGVGIDNNVLFVCDGTAGLKIFDATDKYKLYENLLVQYPENKAFDVISLDGVLLMTGDDGIFQYDYSNLKDIKLLSKIDINAE